MAGHAALGSRRLGDIVKLPLLRRESKERIGEIWKAHHAKRPDAIGRDVAAEHAKLLVARATPAPLFVFPVHRQSGHFMMLAQFTQQRHFLFTSLEEYKAHPTMAQPKLTLTLHDDLAAEKDIVLLRADLESLLTKRESEHLLEQLLMSYLVASRYTSPIGPLAFNTSPQAFDHLAYVRAYPRAAAP